MVKYKANKFINILYVHPTYYLDVNFIEFHGENINPH